MHVGRLIGKNVWQHLTEEGVVQQTALPEARGTVKESFQSLLNAYSYTKSPCSNMGKLSYQKIRNPASIPTLMCVFLILLVGFGHEAQAGSVQCAGCPATATQAPPAPEPKPGDRACPEGQSTPPAPQNAGR